MIFGNELYPSVFPDVRHLSLCYRKVSCNQPNRSHSATRHADYAWSVAGHGLRAPSLFGPCAGQPIKTQPQGPPARKNWRTSSLRPQRLKLQLGRPQLWRLHPGAISSCWIWKLRTPPANPRPPLDPVRTLFSARTPPNRAHDIPTPVAATASSD